MDARNGFYWVACLVLIGLLGNAVIHTSKYQGRKNDQEIQRFETLTYDQAAERFKAVTEELDRRPKTNEEYFTALLDGYKLIGSAQKLMQSPPPKGWAFGQNFRKYDIVHNIPVSVQQQLTQYAMNLQKLSTQPDYEAALLKYDATGFDPIRKPEIFVPGGDQVFSAWMLFHLAVMPFMAIHYMIRMRSRGLRILYEVGHPTFWIWVMLWEIGLFRYPMKVDPAEQLRRIRQWAGLFLSTALSCFAGTGKICEEKQEHAPQHQVYDGVWSRIVISTATLSNYLGLDGGVFFSAPVQQTSVTVPLPCGVYANVFHSEPLAARNLRPNFGREVDFLIGWSRAFDGYAIDANANYANVFPLTTVARGDVLQFSERVTKTIPIGKQNSIAPYFWLRQAVPVRGSTPVGGSFIHWGATFSRSLSDAVSISATAEALHDSGAFGYRPGYLGRMVVGMNWKQSRGISLQFPQIKFTDPLSHTADGRGPSFSFGFGLTFSPAH